jgi:hypothetical protein
MTKDTPIRSPNPGQKCRNSKTRVTQQAAQQQRHQQQFTYLKEELKAQSK